MKLILLERELNKSDYLYSLSPIVKAELATEFKKDKDGNEKPYFDDLKIRSRQNNYLKWSNALDVASDPKDVEKLITAYFDYYPEKNINVDQLRRNNTYDVFQHIIKDLGFKQEDNPFINFLGKMGKDNTVTRMDLVNLVNMYSDGDITFEDVRKDGLLYNKKLWAQTSPATRDQILPIYYYVRKHPKTKDFLDSINNGNSDLINDLANHPDKQADYLVTIDGDPQDSNIRSTNNIIDYYKKYYLQNSANNTNRRSDDNSERERSRRRSDELDNEMKNTITKLARDGKIRARDADKIADEIADYIRDEASKGTIR